MNKKIDQKDIWDKVYSDRNFMTGNRPQKSFLHFIKFLKKEWKKEGKANEYGTSPLAGKSFLDAGAGEGKNSFYLAERGVYVDALEISSVACANFKKRLSEEEREIQASGGFIKLQNGSMSDDFEKKFLYKKEFFDVVIDITSSNALTKKEREKYLDNIKRVLKDDGYFFVRVPAKDENAKKMIKENPAVEKTGEENSYSIPKLGLTETVFTENTFKEIYGKDFKIVSLLKEKHYTRFEEKVYKRSFIVAYLRKK